LNRTRKSSDFKLSKAGTAESGKWKLGLIIDPTCAPACARALTLFFDRKTLFLNGNNLYNEEKIKLAQMLHNMMFLDMA
jgi:hypothetical protein